MDLVMLGCACVFGCAPLIAAPAQAPAQTSVPPATNSPRYDLNGEWELRSSSGQKSNTLSRLMIQQIGDSIVATSITEGDAVHAGGLSFRGTYRTNNFAIEHLCAQVDSPKPVLTIETVTVIDALHLQIEGGCSNSSIWTRFGNPTILLGTSLLFDVNSSDLRPDAQPTLDIVGRMLNESHPGAQLLIAGYTDDLGTDAHNRQLSTRRARAVAAWFQAHGFEKSRIMARGYGEKTPRFPNVNDEARADNRRIEIVVLN
jgi:outer membrane protein OmpA-like peptidoglycan-associated protein